MRERERERSAASKFVGGIATDIIAEAEAESELAKAPIESTASASLLSICRDVLAWIEEMSGVWVEEEYWSGSRVYRS